MLVGKRIRLRAIEREDLPRFATWLNDDDVRQNISLVIPLSLAQEEQWYEEVLKRPAAEQPLMIEAAASEGWMPIGNISFFDFDQRCRSAELGIFIGDKSFWNKGYGREAVQLMVQHGFSHLNLHRIFLRVFQTNPRAIRSYECAGFVHEGRLRQAYFQQGKYIDVLVMSVIASEWTERE